MPLSISSWIKSKWTTKFKIPLYKKPTFTFSRINAIYPSKSQEIEAKNRQEPNWYEALYVIWEVLSIVKLRSSALSWRKLRHRILFSLPTLGRKWWCNITWVLTSCLQTSFLCLLKLWNKEVMPITAFRIKKLSISINS